MLVSRNQMTPHFSCVLYTGRKFHTNGFFPKNCQFMKPTGCTVITFIVTFLIHVSIDICRNKLYSRPHSIQFMEQTFHHYDFEDNLLNRVSLEPCIVCNFFKKDVMNTYAENSTECNHILC